MKKRSNTFPSGVVDTFTFCILSSSSHKTSVISAMKHIWCKVRKKHDLPRRTIGNQYFIDYWFVDNSNAANAHSHTSKIYFYDSCLICLLVPISLCPTSIFTEITVRDEPVTSRIHISWLPHLMKEFVLLPLSQIIAPYSVFGMSQTIRSISSGIWNKFLFTISMKMRSTLHCQLFFPILFTLLIKISANYIWRTRPSHGGSKSSFLFLLKI